MRQDRLIFVDFETYYNTREGYSLSAMPTPAYVRDPRFKALGVAVAVGDQPAEWYDDISILRELDLENALVVAHNAIFDHLILTERMGIVPGRNACTLAMARYCLRLQTYSLAAVARHLKIGEKRDGIVDGSTARTAKLVERGVSDVELCRKIYHVLEDRIPEREWRVMDETIRHSTMAYVDLDTALLKKAMEDERKARADAIAASGVAEDVLSSDLKFAMHLGRLGLKVPTKISKTTGKPTTALAKNDPEFIKLMMDHPEHEALFKGRLAAKSVAKQRRLEAFLAIASHRAPHTKHTFVGQLNYCGATTTLRFSGAGGYNIQNMNRGSALRRAIAAPKGHLIVAADLAQIELRMNMAFCGQRDVLEILRSGGDPYVHTAKAIYGDVEIDKQKRAVGKATMLGCGYGLGQSTFKSYMAGGPLGMPPVFLSDEECRDIITRFRNSIPMVVRMWRTLDSLIQTIPNDRPRTFNGLVFGEGCVRTPTGNRLRYPNLQYRTISDDWSGWFYEVRDPLKDKVKYVSLYGGKLLENIIQHLAREVLIDGVLRVLDQAPWAKLIMTVHDEAVFRIPESRKEEAEALIREAFCTPPEWLPELPLDVSIDTGERYEK